MSNFRKRWQSRPVDFAEQLEPRVLLTGVTISNESLDYNHAPNAFKFDLSAALPTDLTANQFLLDDLTTDTQIPASSLTVTTSTDGLHVTVGVHDLVDAARNLLKRIASPLIPPVADTLSSGPLKLLESDVAPSVFGTFDAKDFLTTTSNGGGDVVVSINSALAELN